MATTLTRLNIPGLNTPAGIAAVTASLREVPGARQLTTQVKDDGDAVVSILSSRGLDAALLGAAVADAGYAIAETEVVTDALAKSVAEQAPARQAAHSAVAFAGATPESDLGEAGDFAATAAA